MNWFDREGLTERRLAFTLMEMMVVIGIIALLMSVVLLVGQGALQSARVKDTVVLIAQVDQAIDAFRTANPYRNVNAAQRRYGPNPPDDLMCYTPKPLYGTNNFDIKMPCLMPGGRGSFCYRMNNTLITAISDDFTGSSLPFVPKGDIQALVWALRSQPESRAIYDSIAPRFKVAVGTDGEFFEMQDANNCSFDPLADKDVQVLVDSWKNPLSYYNVRLPGKLGEAAPLFSEDLTPHAGVAQRLVTLNKNQPVVMSYGPNGELQLGSTPPETLEQQYDTNIPSGGSLFPNPLNEDNVFADETLAFKLRDVQ